MTTCAPVLRASRSSTSQPRIPTLPGCIGAYREKTFTVWSAKDIAAPAEQIGLKGSPTQVRRTFTPAPKGEGRILTGEPSATVRQTLDILLEKGLI